MSHDYVLNEEEQSSLDFGRILAAAKRRFLFFLIPFVIILVATVVVLSFMKPVYEATGTILVETQQIPTDLVQSSITSNPNQRIKIIQQRVMTRRNLLQIIDKYNVFGKDREKLPVSTLIQRMQNQIGIRVITSDVAGGRRRNTETIAFTVSFEHQQPTIAAKVTNELVTLFLSENVKTRTARASETTAFLDNETEKLRQQLTEIENEIVEYKQENRDALPEHLDLRLSMLERTETEIREYGRDIRALEEEKRYLQIELTSARSGRTASGGVVGPSETQQDIDELKQILRDSSTQLTDSHPDIIALNKRIASLQEQLKEEEAQARQTLQEPEQTVDAGYNPLVETLQIRIASADSKISEARSQLVRAKSKVQELEGIIIEIPQVERGLTVLTRTYEDLLEKFNVLESKKSQAQLSQNLEEENKAERFILLEPPEVPSVPVRPNKTKLLSVGGFIALAVGAACALLIELIDKRIRSAAELEALLKHPPLVSIPYIETHAETGKKRMRMVAMGAAALLFVFLVIAGVHFLYEPVDALFYKAWVAIDRLLITVF